MVNFLLKFLKYCERWEYYNSSSFWSFVLGLFFGLKTIGSLQAVEVVSFPLNRAQQTLSTTTQSHAEYETLSNQKDIILAADFIGEYYGEFDAWKKKPSELDRLRGGLQNPSMAEMSNALSAKYVNYQKEYYPNSLPPRFDTTECSESKFKKLAYDPVRKDFTRESIDEARAGVQAEQEKKIKNPTRPSESQTKLINLDLIITGPFPWTHLDIKNPIGSAALIKQGQTITLEEMAYKLGQKIVKQKNLYVGLPGGPVGPENVLHIVDLCYVPSHEKSIVKQNVLQGARNNGSDTGILFLNEI